jgi:two-component system response regulator (stage 0 sporulation protein A)
MNEKKLNETMLQLGHDDRTSGTAALRAAVRMYEGQPLTKELYPAIARATGSTAARIERNIRTAIDKAWLRADPVVQRQIFGRSYDLRRGKPTSGEYIARLAALIREDED